MPPSPVSTSRPAMLARIKAGTGFIAALDQSGGSTPRTLTQYGLPPDSWLDDEQMFDLIHQMRCRVLTSPAFRPERILGVILFERTMEGLVENRPVPDLLRERGIASFLKVDQGLQAENDGVQLMKPIPALEGRLAKAGERGILGTKMRSLIRRSSPRRIAAVVDQQFEFAEMIAEAGLLPIVEPEYDIAAPDRAVGELLLKKELLRRLDRLPEEHQVILKLSIPAEPNTYRELAQHPRVARLAALSGGYTRSDACRELAKNEGMIASFSRALLQDLRVWMTQDEFDAALAEAIAEIYRASLHARA